MTSHSKTTLFLAVVVALQVAAAMESLKCGEKVSDDKAKQWLKDCGAGDASKCAACTDKIVSGLKGAVGTVDCKDSGAAKSVLMTCTNELMPKFFKAAGDLGVSISGCDQGAAVKKIQ